MINFDNIALDYEPYPIGVTRPAYDPEFYQDLVSSFPQIEMFKYKESKGDKFSLSQVNHGKKYKKFVNSPPAKAGGFRLRLKAGSGRHTADWQCEQRTKHSSVW